MKTAYTTAALITASVFAASTNAALVDGQTIGIDFASGPNTPGSGAEANFVLLTGDVTGAATTDTTGGSTGGVTVSVVGAQGVMGESDLGFGAAGTGDYGSFGITDLTYNDGVFNNIGGATFITITFSGLDDSLNYDIVGFVNGGNTINNTVPVTFSADGVDILTTGAATSGGSSSGTLAPAIISSASTDGSGVLEVTFSTNNTPFGIGGLTLTAVPEPGSLALLGLGGLCVLRRRRR
ncbi:MAG: PEP-CTERM sorting domain-containing protein [Planctomycetota bacterium]